MKLTMYYAYVGEQVVGPMTPSQMREMYETGQINDDSHVCTSDDQTWIAFRHSRLVPGIDATHRARQAQKNIEELRRNVSSPPHEGDKTLTAAGSGLQALGVAVTLVNPIVGVGMIVAGSKVKKAGEP